MCTPGLGRSQFFDEIFAGRDSVGGLEWLI